MSNIARRDFQGFHLSQDILGQGNNLPIKNLNSIDVCFPHFSYYQLIKIIV